MKKLHAYMLKSYLGPFLMTFFITLFILLMQFLWKYVDDLVGKGLEWSIILRLLFYASATFVPLALPLAVLLSSLMTFGNLGEHYELVAIKSSGISLQKAMEPLTILAVVISISAFLFSNYVFPVANLKFGSLLYDIRQKKLAFNLDEGIFDNELNGYVIRAGRKAKDNKTIYDVMIYDHTQRMGDTKVTVAKKGLMELSPNQRHLIITLYDGYNYNEVTNERGYRTKHPFEEIKFKKQILSFDLSQLQLSHTDESLFKNHYSMLNIKQLNHAIDSLSGMLRERELLFRKNALRRFQCLLPPKKPEKNKRYRKPVQHAAAKPEKTNGPAITYPFLKNFDVDARHQILEFAHSQIHTAEDNVLFNADRIVKPRKQLIVRHEIVWHQKFKLSLACLIFFFIGAPLGAIIRKGGLGLPVVISVIFFVIYHVISVTGEKAARTGEMSVVFGVWLSTLIIFPLGIFLTYKATTDSPLLDIESWRKYFEKHKGLQKIVTTLNNVKIPFPKKKK
jgi:lipopolysaccharide export system permease protein